MSYSPHWFEPVFSQGLTGLRDMGNSGDMASTSSQYAHFQPSAYTIPYSFSSRLVPATNSPSYLALPALTPASLLQKAPPSQSSMPPRSQPFPPGHCQKPLFATGKTPSFARLSFVITGINNPSVQSKVAPASDSGPEPSVE
ncbi:hypothetical protein BU17DRAFT_103193 [Hysterangium stoloniferum]|nr:hypothetical protein BU17DRAFT_103193 [Hysterangium stoloniferum]